MEFKWVSDIEPTKETGLVSYCKKDGYFTFINDKNNVKYDYYCRTLQEFVDLLRQLTNKKWFSMDMQRDTFNLYDSIVRK